MDTFKMLVSEKKTDPKRKTKPSSLWRGLFQQVFITFAMNLHSMSVGAALAYPTIVLSNVHSGNWSREGKREYPQDASHLNDEEEKMTYNDDQASWYGSVSVMSVILGSLVAALVQPRFGRRTVLIVADIFLATAWSLSSVAQQPPLLLASTVLASLYAGSLVAPLLLYQSETLNHQFLRTPILISINHFSLLLGLAMEMTLGAILDWRTVSAINTLFPGTSLIILLLLSESPSYLRQRQRKTETFSVFQCFRRLSPIIGRTSKTDDVEASPPSTLPTKTKPQLQSIALLVASLCYHHLSGMTVLRTYSIPFIYMLSTNEVPSYAYAFPAILGCAQICGGALGLLFRGWTERSCRLPILLASFLGNVGCSLALGLYSRFFIQKPLSPYISINIASALPVWLPSVLLGIFAFCSCMSIPLIPYSFVGEFYPSFARGLSSRIALLLSCICCFLSNKLFFLTIKLIGLSNLFCLYATMGLICAGIICVLLPRELEEKTAKNPMQETNEDSMGKCPESLSDVNSEKKSKVLPVSIIEPERMSNYSSSKEIRSTKEKYSQKVPASNIKKSSLQDIWKERKNLRALRTFDRKAPDWLGDISWTAKQGGWLVEETKRGGWRVLERHQGGEGRSMEVEQGTWIGHMIQVVTKAVTEEESKDLSKWKLTTRPRKWWVIMKGPNNQWQICSSPWESDTSDEIEDESDDVEESENESETSYFDDSNSIISDESKSPGRIIEVLNENTTNSTDNSDAVVINSIDPQSLCAEKNLKDNYRNYKKFYQRSYSAGECKSYERNMNTQ